MTDANSESERVKRYHTRQHFLETIARYTDTPRIRQLAEVLARWHHQQLEAKVAEARLQTAKAIASMGRDNPLWDEVTPEVLELLPDFASSTADIPRGKKQFLDFIIAHLTNNKTTSHEQEG